MTSADLRELDADTRVLIAPLEARGVTEPTLYFARVPEAAERFAAVIAERAASRTG